MKNSLNSYTAVLLVILKSYRSFIAIVLPLIVTYQSRVKRTYCTGGQNTECQWNPCNWSQTMKKPVTPVVILILERYVLFVLT